ncbi:MAG: glycosyltransferase [Lachnospiraceae bacterium]
MKRHIAFYISSLRKGGAERVFANLAEYFYSKGYQVTVVTQYISDNEYSINPGIQRTISDIEETECSRFRIINFYRRFIKLRRIWMQIRPNLVFSCIGKNNFMAIATTLFSKIKVVVSIVGEPTAEYDTKGMRLTAKLLFRQADGIVFQTQDAKAFFPKYLQKKAIILPNSLNPLFIQERYTGVRDKQIVTVGRLDGNKNQKMLIEAFAGIEKKYPDYSVVCYGGGESRDKLTALIERLGLRNRVQLPGVTTDIVSAIRKSTLFVLTSDTEGMPNALIEAMALGLPVISTDCPCGGPRELITHGKNGMLIPVRGTETLTRTLDTLLSDAQLREQLGKNAAQIQERLHPDKINKQWESYFEKILGER